MEIQLLTIDMVNNDTRPMLYDMISIAGGTAFILSKEVLSNEPDDEKLLVLLKGDTNLMLIEDSPKGADGSSESFKAILIDEAAAKALKQIIAPIKQRRESTGRPKIYNDDDARELFIENYKNNKSIKKLSFERDMSPTTIQKLLNGFRMDLAKKIVADVDVSDLLPNNDDKLKILEWAIAKSDGDERREFEQYYFKVMN